MNVGEFSDLIYKLTKSAIDTGPDDHQAAQIEFLKDAIQFDAAWWGWSNFTAGKNRLINTGVYGLPAAFEGSARAIAHTDPLIRYGRNLSVFSKTIHVGRETLQPDFQKCLNMFQIDAILSGHCRLQGDTQFNFFLSLYKLNSDNRFTEAETQDFQFILRHLEQNLSLSLRAELRAMAPTGGEAAFVCVGGAVIRATRSFNERLLEEGFSPAEISQLLKEISLGRRRCESHAIVLEGSPYGKDWMLIRLAHKNALLGLSREERRVAELLVQGRSMKEIAQYKGVSHNTIRNQVASIYRKTGVNNRVQFLSQARIG